MIAQPACEYRDRNVTRLADVCECAQYFHWTVAKRDFEAGQGQAVTALWAVMACL